MDEDFVRSDWELVDVLRRATDDEFAVLIEVMRKAASCWLTESCRDPMEIADELQKLGGNTYANNLRGHGVKYQEIVSDVGEKLGAKLKGAASIAHMEWLVSMRVLERAAKKLNKKERLELEQHMREHIGASAGQDIWEILNSPTLPASARLGVIEFVVVLALEKLDLASRAHVLRYVGSFVGGFLGAPAGPIGAAVAGIVLFIIGDIISNVLHAPGTAFKATIPAVFVIAQIRARMDAEEQASRAPGYEVRRQRPTKRPGTQWTHVGADRASVERFVATPTTAAPERKEATLSPRERELRRMVDYFGMNGPIYRPNAILLGKVRVPKQKGAYAWYFRTIPKAIPSGRYIRIGDWTLLYIGIAGKRGSDKTLQERLEGKHLKGDATNSTVRWSLGCLLCETLRLSPERRWKSDVWFGEEGKGALTDWMKRNVRFNWLVDDRPWEIEDLAFEEYGELLPLNDRDNRKNPFIPELRKIKKACKDRAFGR